MSVDHIQIDHFPEKKQIKLASSAALASLFNLTFLPVIAFIWLFIQWKKSPAKGVDNYHILFAIKLNIAAAFALVVISALMIIFGGFNSPWTWVYVISYFTLIHSLFIIIAVWALTRAWSGKEVF